MKSTKKWYVSKTVWTAIVTGTLGVIQAFGVNIPVELYALLGSFGLYSLRVGKSKLI